MRRGFVVAAGFYAVCSLSLVAVSRWLDSAAADNTDVNQSFYTGSPGLLQVGRQVREIDFGILDQAADLGLRSFRVRWDGVWYFPGDSLIYLDARTDGRVLVSEQALHEAIRFRDLSEVPLRIGVTKAYETFDPLHGGRFE